MKVSELIMYITLCAPIISIFIGSLAAVEKERSYGKASKGVTIPKGIGLLIIPALIVQFIPLALFYVSELSVWRGFVIAGAIALLFILVPFNYRLSYNMTRKTYL